MKVSVIVPTYRTPQFALERLITSLDNQTMPQEDFEVIFVDDGSPDDTVRRIRTLRASRPNLRILRIANSGWPSRPRNVGLDEAHGKYVVFMDHDDELYPDALRATYDYATLHGSDAVNGKEAYTNRPDWALGTYKEDQPQSVGRMDTHPLLPMNPHKLYRLAFLNQHRIRFPEGRRVLWEDVFFNLRVAREARVISTLSSVPFYHWAESKGGGSDTAFAKWTDDYWHWYRLVLTETAAQLSEAERTVELNQLMSRQYVNRVLGAFDKTYGDRPDEACEFIFNHCRALRHDFDLSRFDGNLGPSQRARAHVLGEGDASLMKLLCREDVPLQAVAKATSAEWRQGQLHLSASVSWSGPDGNPVVLRREKGRVVREYSDELTAALPPDVRDWTTQVEHPSATLTLRHRTSRIAWAVPSETTTQLSEFSDDAPKLACIVHATVDPMSAAMGSALPTGYWDIFQGSSLQPLQQPLKSNISASALVSHGRLHLAYPNDSGNATIFADGQFEAVHRLAPTRARLNSQGELEIVLAGRHDGSGEVETSVSALDPAAGDQRFSPVPAHLTVSEGVAALKIPRPLGAVRVRVGSKAGGADGEFRVAVINGEIQTGPQADDVRLTPKCALAAAREGRGKLRILILTDKDSDDVGDQLVEACTVSAVTGAMSNLGIPASGFAIESRSVGVVPMKYVRSRDPALLHSARIALSRSDLLIFGGDPVLRHARQPFSERTAATLELAEQLSVPAIFYGTGIDPFDAANPSAMALKSALRLSVVKQLTTTSTLPSLADYATPNIPVAQVLDPVSLAGVAFREPPKARVGTDTSPTAFLRRIAPYSAKVLIRRLQGRPAPKRPTVRRKVVGLVVTRAGIFKDNGIDFGRKRQARFWLDTISALEDRGYDYRVFSTGHFADDVFLDELVASGRIPQSKAASSVNSPDELIANLRSCDGVIAFRLRANVAAFALGIPSIGLTLDSETSRFYASVGYKHRAMGHKQWTAGAVVPALIKAMRSGVRRKPDVLTSTYAALFTGIKSVFDPEGDQAPYHDGELQTKLPRYPGTTQRQYRAKQERKLRRAYEAYRGYAYL